jgi:hypothetical protein
MYAILGEDGAHLRPGSARSFLSGLGVRFAERGKKPTFIAMRNCRFYRLFELRLKKDAAVIFK